MRSSIEENIIEVKRRVEEAAKKAGRNPEDVLILAVSKTIDVPRIKEAVQCGLNSLGENRVQEIMDKYEPMGEGINWHLIGHLQTNKVKYIIDKVCLIHSVESLKLADEINKKAEKAGIIMDILVEVNIANEESKFGIKPEDCESFIRELSKMKNINVKGLMTVAPFTENPEENRVYFKGLKDLLVDINNKKIDNINMSELSMGMTGDFEVAVEEGATIVRVGTGIFGERFYPNKK
ncbi:YggS family pyridoxal phosphate enzyme [Tyzzerella sp. An114]|uniref:YggS family pyridoxal phosphate-dependent enzyme n=1 Tax=Tyzzerella sp. An114 TaxID=1965545 RepID=UPI000B449711|nr:YggS family pyridoxal phosphate-dependent enzyme [Tyzzerella sp. An114]OUQ59478.1 YggS family pyridoxal phosphate enzyme [Tyzzerella sp. An114]HIT72387.1 YggS family pyridoxal phosphate-dependent enzyme [Candidatus Fimicola cottocaccae]